MIPTDDDLLSVGDSGGRVIRGMPNERYHAGPGLSHSGAKRLLITPFHFHALDQARDDDVPSTQPTPQQLNGTLVHCAFLEPGEFEARYVIAPDVRRNTRAYREFAAELEGTGFQPITAEQRDAAYRQANALRTLPDIAQLMRRGEPELSVYWRDPATAALCKCRPDWKSPVGRDDSSVILLDVKTAADASPEGFARAVAKFGYHTQADWYCSGYALATGVPVHGMVFAVVESEYPHACAAYMLSDEALRRGREDNMRARELYAQCLKTERWPGYAPQIQIIDLPRWAA
jgi:PDDEXK-like domain of unknown function (DUF3799)